jgi:hypothetical protein
MTESSLYERLGGAFAIAAVIDHFSEAVVHNPIIGQESRTRPFGNGTATIWVDLRASNSCAACGSATLPAGPSNMRPRNRAVLLLAWKKLTAN